MTPLSYPPKRCKFTLGSTFVFCVSQLCSLRCQMFLSITLQYAKHTYRIVLPDSESQRHASTKHKKLKHSSLSNMQNTQYIPYYKTPSLRDMRLQKTKHKKLQHFITLQYAKHTIHSVLPDSESQRHASTKHKT